MKNAIIERMLYVLLLLVFVAALMFGFLAVSATNELNHQQARLDEQSRDIRSILDGQGKAVDRIQNSLRCILTFFSLENRNNLVLDDLNSCTVRNTQSDETKQLDLPPPQVSHPEDNRIGNQKSQPVTPPKQTTPDPTPPKKSPPAEVLGIPVCVPLVDICLRR